MVPLGRGPPPPFEFVTTYRFLIGAVAPVTDLAALSGLFFEVGFEHFSAREYHP